MHQYWKKGEWERETATCCRGYRDTKRGVASLPLLGSVLVDTINELHQGTLASEPRPPVFKRTRGHLFGPQQSVLSIHATPNKPCCTWKRTRVSLKRVKQRQFECALTEIGSVTAYKQKQEYVPVEFLERKDVFLILLLYCTS